MYVFTPSSATAQLEFIFLAVFGGSLHVLTIMMMMMMMMTTTLTYDDGVKLVCTSVFSHFVDNVTDAQMKSKHTDVKGGRGGNFDEMIITDDHNQNLEQTYCCSKEERFLVEKFFDQFFWFSMFVSIQPAASQGGRSI